MEETDRAFLRLDGNQLWHGRDIGGRTEHLESLPDGLFKENMGGRIRVRTVLDALHVLPFAPERVTGALEKRKSRGGKEKETGKSPRSESSPRAGAGW